VSFLIVMLKLGTMISFPFSLALVKVVLHVNNFSD
jgi:hypothetical protein